MQITSRNDYYINFQDIDIFSSILSLKLKQRSIVEKDNCKHNYIIMRIEGIMSKREIVRSFKLYKINDKLCEDEERTYLRSG